jgi:hypothetical protein
VAAQVGKKGMGEEVGSGIDFTLLQEKYFNLFRSNMKVETL